MQFFVWKYVLVTRFLGKLIVLLIFHWSLCNKKYSLIKYIPNVMHIDVLICPHIPLKIIWHTQGKLSLCKKPLILDYFVSNVMAWFELQRRYLKVSISSFLIKFVILAILWSLNIVSLFDKAVHVMHLQSVSICTCQTTH